MAPTYSWWFRKKSVCKEKKRDSNKTNANVVNNGVSVWSFFGMRWLWEWGSRQGRSPLRLQEKPGILTVGTNGAPLGSVSTIHFSDSSHLCLPPLLPWLMLCSLTWQLSMQEWKILQLINAFLRNVIFPKSRHSWNRAVNSTEFAPLSTNKC